MSDVTLVLQAVSRGEKQSSDELLPLVYEELKRLAAARLAREAEGQTLQATALVHEAWLRMVRAGERNWQNRAYFFASAAQAMRRILIDNARRKARLKHGGCHQRVSIEELDLAAVTPDEKILLIDEALTQLESEDPERARVVSLRFFSGLTSKEVAQVMGISESTVARHWVCAKEWLVRRIYAPN